MICSAITTFDNPYDPFDNFNSWLMFDMDKGYNSCGLLDSFAKTSDSLSEEENNIIIDKAIDDIIIHDPLNIYKKVKKEIKDD